jgi:hypothetical protein
VVRSGAQDAHARINGRSMAFESVREFIDSIGSVMDSFACRCSFRRQISDLLSASLERWSLSPGEDLAPLALEYAAREDLQPPGGQPNGGERV